MVCVEEVVEIHNAYENPFYYSLRANVDFALSLMAEGVMVRRQKVIPGEWGKWRRTRASSGACSKGWHQ